MAKICNYFSDEEELCENKALYMTSMASIK